MQDCSISTALAVEILQSCTKPSIYNIALPRIDGDFKQLNHSGLIICNSNIHVYPLFHMLLNGLKMIYEAFMVIIVVHIYIVLSDRITTIDKIIQNSNQCTFKSMLVTSTCVLHHSERPYASNFIKLHKNNAFLLQLECDRCRFDDKPYVHSGYKSKPQTVT